MDYQAAAKVLGEELVAQGYTWRLDRKHDHPRLYIGSGEHERFVLMSTTESYEKSNVMHIKREDVRRVLRELPPSPPKLIAPVPKVEKAPEFAPVSDKLYSTRLFIQGGGIFGIAIPKEVIPEGKPHANLSVTTDGRLMLIFRSTGSSEHGTPRWSTLPGRGTRVAYRYAHREQLPFKCASRVPAGWKAPEITARLRGDTLVLDQPIPKELLAKYEEKPPASVPEQFDLNAGKELLSSLNEWLAQARAAGCNVLPTVSDDALTVHVKVTYTIDEEL